MNDIKFFILLALIAALFVQQQCQSPKEAKEVIHTQTKVVIDTQRPPPIIVRMKQQAPPPPVVIYPNDRGEPLPWADVDTTQHLPANLYTDSVEDENQIIYSAATVRGELLANRVSYKLKIPKVITKEIKTTKVVARPISRILLTGGVSFIPKQKTSFEAGVQFVSAKGWAVGYNYDVLNNSHKVNLGFPLYQFKPPK